MAAVFEETRSLKAGSTLDHLFGQFLAAAVIPDLLMVSLYVPYVVLRSRDRKLCQPGHLMVGPAIDGQGTDDLRARGHTLAVSGPWSIGRLTAASRNPQGIMKAAATPRLMQAYAVGR